MRINWKALSGAFLFLILSIFVGAQATPQDVLLHWNEVTGKTCPCDYDVLRSDTQGGPYLMINSGTVPAGPAPTYTDNQTIIGDTYYYVVRATDTTGKQSPFSNEAQATIGVRTATRPHAPVTGGLWQ
jgi:hypothetical protein